MSYLCNVNTCVTILLDLNSLKITVGSTQSPPPIPVHGTVSRIQSVQ